jgi:hypothetical protein
MRNRASLLTLALFALAAPVLSQAGCSYRNPDQVYVNQNPYWAKAYFDPSVAWYYRATVVDTAPNYSGPLGFFDVSTGIADGDWLMLERVRWEVTENQLIGWSERASAPGSELDNKPGAEDIYRGEAVAIFAITEHFDIKRNYDPTTGEEGNIVAENTDRPWYQREFIRVDWSKNLVPTYKFHVWLEQMGDGYTVSNDDPANPKRFRFETDNGETVANGGKPTYFEITTRSMMSTDLASYYGFYGEAYKYDTAAQLLDIRHTFMRVPDGDSESTYVPQPMPPSVVMVDEDGDEVRDQNGFAVRVPINDRFGFFGTLGRQTYDENRGVVEAGQIWNASRFDIWQASKNAAGEVIPIEQREPKPIVYYTNVEHPKSLMEASQRVAADWNRTFKEVVFHAQPNKYDSLDDVPDMWILKENDCNVANVEAVLNGLPAESRPLITTKARTLDGRFDGTIASVKARYEQANDPDAEFADFTTRQGVETQALADLERICASLEYYTGGDITVGRPKIGDRAFKYQRLGDTRYSMLNLVMQDLQSGWLGLGPPYSDPFTGQTISATANVAIHLLDYYAARSARQVGILNGELSPTDLAFGTDIQSYMRKKLAENKILVGKAASSQALKQSMDQRMAAQIARPDALREISPNRAEQRKEKLKGTAIEQMLVSNDDVMAFGGVDPTAAATGSYDLNEELLERVSPLRGGVSVEDAIARERKIIRMGQRAMDPPEYLDSMVLGRAIELRDMSYEERFMKLRSEIYVAVMLHEVGHNMGLMHNFAASSDALNYGPRFWQLQKLPADIDDAIDEVEDEDDLAALEKCADEIDDIREAAGQPDFVLTTQDCLLQTEGMYASIMDYHAGFNSDFNGLGNYDRQAIKFAYGNLLEVFNEDAYANDFEPTGEKDLKRWIFLNDWRDLAGDVLKNEDAIDEGRDYVKFEWNRASTASALPERTVPYRFCYGWPPEPSCHTYDIGPDTQTNAVHYLNQYYQRYFFTHFARERLWNWDFLSVTQDLGAMLDFTEKMQFYFFYKATDPEFTGSYAETDYLATTTTGLNFLSSVIGHPGSGRYINPPTYDVFGLTNLPAADRVPGDGVTAAPETPSDIMMPWNYLTECQSLRVTEDGDFAAPLPGFQSANIALGDGRPFFIGLTEDYEDWYVRYIGTYWSKQLAIQLLGYNYAWFPRYDDAPDFRSVDVSWYRLFPKEVAKIFNGLITDQYVDLGPVVDAQGTLHHRDLIDPATGEAPSYAGMKRVLPSISFNHEYFAAVYANIYMRSPTDDQFDITKSMKVAMLGGEDDISAFDQAIAEDVAGGCPDPAVDGEVAYEACPTSRVASFTHPVSGLTIRALKAGDEPIAWNLMKRVHAMAERYEILETCMTQLEDGDPATNPDHEYCACIESVDYNAAGNLVCTDTKLFAPGVSICNEYDLKNRRDSAREQMDDMFDYLGDIRILNRIFETELFSG